MFISAELKAAATLRVSAFAKELARLLVVGAAERRRSPSLSRSGLGTAARARFLSNLGDPTLGAATQEAQRSTR
jgi:hypothetical protein